MRLYKGLVADEKIHGRARSAQGKMKALQLIIMNRGVGQALGPVVRSIHVRSTPDAYLNNLAATYVAKQTSTASLRRWLNPFLIKTLNCSHQGSNQTLEPNFDACHILAVTHPAYARCAPSKIARIYRLPPQQLVGSTLRWANQ